MSTLATDRTGSGRPGATALDSALNLAGRLFWDRQVFAAEVDRLFSTRWQCVGRREDVEKPGDYLVTEVAGDSVLVVHADDGGLRGFYNVCRHRGTQMLAEGRGEGLSRVVCPYHAWVYSAGGALLSAPKMEASDSFATCDFGLVPVGLGIWEGFVFVNLEAESGSLQAALADAPDLGGYGLGALRRGASREYEVAANWKIVCENYSECYHCGPVHPHLHKLSDGSGPRAPHEGRCYNGGPMSLKPGVDTMSFSGRSPRRPLPGLDEDQRRCVEYFVVYPNLLLSLHPDYVLVHRVKPLRAGRSRVICEWLFHPDEVGRGDFDPQDAVEFWDLTNRQDWELCESVQRGVRSRGHRPGRYQETEDCVFFFDRWYLEAMGW